MEEKIIGLVMNNMHIESEMRDLINSSAEDGKLSESGLMNILEKIRKNMESINWIQQNIDGLTNEEKNRLNEICQNILDNSAPQIELLLDKLSKIAEGK